MKYFYYGIYVGEKVGVIYFGGENKFDVKIKDDDIMVFWGFKILIKIMYLNGEDRDFKKVIRIVMRLKNNLVRWGKFDLIDNNCEYFVIYCKIGKVVLM